MRLRLPSPVPPSCCPLLSVAPSLLSPSILFPPSPFLSRSSPFLALLTALWGDEYGQKPWHPKPGTTTSREPIGAFHLPLRDPHGSAPYPFSFLSGHGSCEPQRQRERVHRSVHKSMSTVHASARGKLLGAPGNCTQEYKKISLLIMKKIIENL